MTVAELRAGAYTAGVGVVGALILPHSGGARLTPEYLVALSVFGRERRIRWAEVSRIDVHRRLGTSRVRVSLVTGERLARCVTEDGWTLPRAAGRFQVAPITVQRLASRYGQARPVLRVGACSSSVCGRQLPGQDRPGW